MDREEIKNRVVEYFRKQIQLKNERPEYNPQIQMGALYELVTDLLATVPGYKRNEVYSLVREVVHEFVLGGFLYPGSPGDQNSGYPWLTITSHGREAFMAENWLPYDPDGYVKAIKQNVSQLDDVTLAYISESVAAFNRRHLLSATITLGVASENIMLLLIEAYQNWLQDPARKASFQKRIEERGIYKQFKEFKAEFSIDVKTLPKELQSDWEVYIDGVFNFIRLNRNSVGHPTGKELNAKIVYANLQIFADYAKYIFDLLAHLR